MHYHIHNLTLLSKGALSPIVMPGSGPANLLTSVSAQARLAHSISWTQPAQGPALPHSGEQGSSVTCLICQLEHRVRLCHGAGRYDPNRYGGKTHQRLFSPGMSTNTQYSSKQSPRRR